LAAVPSIGRASAVEPRPAGPEAQATSLLYERYARQIFNFCLHRLGNREEAEDAAQTTFLNAFRGIQRGVTPELEQAWLFKIAENVCLTRHRSSFRRRRVESPSDLDVLQELVPSPQRDAETLIRLPDALVEMPEQQRRALLLREWQGLSYREIAEELELSQPAVETLLFRARRSLASALTEAPERKRRARLRSGIDIGGILVAVKSAFAGGAAVKVAAVAAVATTTAVAGNKVQALQHAQTHKASAPAAVEAATRRAPAPTPARRVTLTAPVAASRGGVHRAGTARQAAPEAAKAAPVVVHDAPAQTPVAEPAATVPVQTAPVHTAPAGPDAAAVEPADAAPARRERVAALSEPRKVERGLSSDAAVAAHGRHGSEKHNGHAEPPEPVAPTVDPAAAETSSGHGKGPKADLPSEEPALPVETAVPADPAAAPPAEGNGKHLGQRK
jgi:RNA polymerase sigma factor (sigma-70 family)